MLPTPCKIPLITGAIAVIIFPTTVTASAIIDVTFSKENPILFAESEKIFPIDKSTGPTASNTLPTELSKDGITVMTLSSASVIIGNAFSPMDVSITIP